MVPSAGAGADFWSFDLPSITMETFEDSISNFGQPTISLRRLSLPYFPFLFQIDIPVVRLPFFIFECKGEDGIALLNGVFSLSGI